MWFLSSFIYYLSAYLNATEKVLTALLQVIGVVIMTVFQLICVSHSLVYREATSDIQKFAAYIFILFSIFYFVLLPYYFMGNKQKQKQKSWIVWYSIADFLCFLISTTMSKNTPMILKILFFSLFIAKLVFQIIYASIYFENQGFDGFYGLLKEIRSLFRRTAVEAVTKVPVTFHEDMKNKSQQPMQIVYVDNKQYVQVPEVKEIPEVKFEEMKFEEIPEMKFEEIKNMVQSDNLSEKKKEIYQQTPENFPDQGENINKNHVSKNELEKKPITQASQSQDAIINTNEEAIEQQYKIPDQEYKAEEDKKSDEDVIKEEEYAIDEKLKLVSVQKKTLASQNMEFSRLMNTWLLKNKQNDELKKQKQQGYADLVKINDGEKKKIKERIGIIKLQVAQARQKIAEDQRDVEQRKEKLQKNKTVVQNVEKNEWDAKSEENKDTHELVSEENNIEQQTDNIEEQLKKQTEERSIEEEERRIEREWNLVLDKHQWIYTQIEKFDDQLEDAQQFDGEQNANIQKQIEEAEKYIAETEKKIAEDMQKIEERKKNKTVVQNAQNIDQDAADKPGEEKKEVVLDSGNEQQKIEKELTSILADIDTQRQKIEQHNVDVKQLTESWMEKNKQIELLKKDEKGNADQIKLFQDENDKINTQIMEIGIQKDQIQNWIAVTEKKITEDKQKRALIDVQKQEM